MLIVRPDSSTRFLAAAAFAGFAAAMLATSPAGAFTLDVPEDRLGHTTVPLELRARDRAVELFNSGDKKKKKHRFKWADKPSISLEYERPVKLMRRDMIMEFKVPGKKGTWARFRLKF